MRWRRFRKWAKWVCTVAAGAAVGLAVFGGIYRLGIYGFYRDDSAFWCVTVGEGLLYGGCIDGVSSRDLRAVGNWRLDRLPGWTWGRASESFNSGGKASWQAGVLRYPHSSGWGAGVSLAYPVLLTAIPAALLWYADRRRFGPGRCAKCGYDRHGLAADAKCPECGMVPRTREQAGRWRDMRNG